MNPTLKHKSLQWGTETHWRLIMVFLEKPLSLEYPPLEVLVYGSILLKTNKIIKPNVKLIDIIIWVFRKIVENQQLSVIA
jgi:hypothetical protein